MYVARLRSGPGNTWKRLQRLENAREMQQKVPFVVGVYACGLPEAGDAG
jgi:hypothetical protein